MAGEALEIPQANTQILTVERPIIERAFGVDGLEGKPLTARKTEELGHNVLILRSGVAMICARSVDGKTLGLGLLEGFALPFGNQTKEDYGDSEVFIRALTPCNVINVSPKQVSEIAEQNPVILKWLISETTSRQTERSKVAKEILSPKKRLENRTAQVLLNLDTFFPNQLVPVTQHDIAELSNDDFRRVNPFLNLLKRNSAVTFNKRVGIRISGEKGRKILEDFVSGRRSVHGLGTGVVTEGIKTPADKVELSV